MKRKKQTEEYINHHRDEPKLRRDRLARKLRKLGVSEENDTKEKAGSGLSTRRSSREGKNENEDGLGAASSQQREGNDDEADENGISVGEDWRIAEETQVADEPFASEEGIGRVNGKFEKRVDRALSCRAKKAPANVMTPVKGSNGSKLLTTPNKIHGTTDEAPKFERHVDRSARRKSTRNLIERTLLGNTSDNEEREEDIENHIHGSEAEEGEVPGATVFDEMEGNVEETVSAPETPSRRLGRPRGSKNKHQSPPITDLPPHELYFSQNRSGRLKTSNNSLSSLKLLDYDEYFTLVRQFKDPYTSDMEWLQELHAGSFNQWNFELSQSFNICLFGWGSKKSLLTKFAEYTYQSQEEHSRDTIIVVNGYVQSLTIRDVLNTVAATISNPAPKLGAQPTDMLDNLLNLLSGNTSQHIIIIIHSIDGAPLRRPATQIILSRLSAHPQIHLIASADHPSFPLLWDSSLRSTYNFLFHDCTTFQPYTSEVDVVEEVHELLGRSGRRVGGKEGVSFVLKSLPENAKNLFRVLIGEQLAAMDDNGGAVDSEDDRNDAETRHGSQRHEQGVEYRVLYQKAVEDFICSNEMNFRTLLKE